MDAAGHRRQPVTLPGYHVGRPPRNKGQRYPADPPTVEEIIAVMRTAGADPEGVRLRALIVVLWRAGLRIGEALALAETDLDARRGAVVVRHGPRARLSDSLVLRGPLGDDFVDRVFGGEMETVVERPAALDVHKEQVTACVRVPGEGRSREHVAEFSTTVAGLLTLLDWLSAFGVQQVVMEATGVYWKPVWAILEDTFECFARHVKQVALV